MAEEEGKGVSIDDFIIVQKITAFCDSYFNVEEESQADEVFTDIKLRKYFQAYPRNIGDPLIGYLDMLTQKHGFKMRTSITGEPAIFVRCIERKRNNLLDETFS